ncbi:helix-turn-helix transcriptional regulator [Kiritimatiellota bacterium B12222]|nr:helix-turn-helix transcriptional regulator [Kiritimatiellota bacterium B12222]
MGVSARIEQGLTIRDLADKLEWHHSALGRVEAFERRLDLWEFIKICKALDCDPVEGMNLII